VNIVAGPRGNGAITAAVWLHADVTAVHSAAHVRAGVWMSVPATVYIWLVIIVGPIAGRGLVRSLGGFRSVRHRLGRPRAVP